MFDFEDAAPTRGDAAPNPFADIVKSIADAKDANGAPIAKAFWLPVGTDDASKRAHSRTLRLLSEAGPLANVSVMKDVSEDIIQPYQITKDEETGEETVVNSGEYTKPDGKKSVNKSGKPAVLVTFWSGPPQKRTRTKTETAPTKTDAPPTTEKTDTPTEKTATPATAKKPAPASFRAPANGVKK